jgi:hypothetical protein
VAHPEERGFFQEPYRRDACAAIAWPEGIELKPSTRDANAPLLKEIEAELPFEYEPRS